MAAFCCLLVHSENALHSSSPVHLVTSLVWVSARFSVYLFMCLKEEPEMNALLHVATSCLDDMTTPHGLQPREVCLSSDLVFSCEQNCQFKDDGKGHTLKDIK